MIFASPGHRTQFTFQKYPCLGPQMTTSGEVGHNLKQGAIDAQLAAQKRTYIHAPNRTFSMKTEYAWDTLEAGTIHESDASSSCCSCVVLFWPSEVSLLG